MGDDRCQEFLPGHGLSFPERVESATVRQDASHAVATTGGDGDPWSQCLRSRLWKTCAPMIFSEPSSAKGSAVIGSSGYQSLGGKPRNQNTGQECAISLASSTICSVLSGTADGGRHGKSHARWNIESSGKPYRTQAIWAASAALCSQTLGPS